MAKTWNWEFSMFEIINTTTYKWSSSYKTMNVLNMGITSWGSAVSSAVYEVSVFDIIK